MPRKSLILHHLLGRVLETFVGMRDASADRSSLLSGRLSEREERKGIRDCHGFLDLLLVGWGFEAETWRWGLEGMV